MKLYKLDYKGTIGNNVITVPTDSQFLIGISNGDSEADVELLDGETEITPEDEKIGAYTVFNFETDGTPFRKNYKAVINGNNFEDKSLWTLFFDDVNYKDFTSIAFAIPDNVNIENLNYEAGKTPVLTSFQTFVYGADWSTGKPIFHYLETITLTWNSNKTAYEVPIDMGGLSWCKYIQFSECSEDRLFYNYGQTSYNDFGDGDVTPEEGKKTVPAPIPYTQNIDLLVICQKMSVAYCDFEGGGGGGSSPVPYLHYYEVEQDETIVVHVTPDNIADIAQTCYVINEASNGVEMKIDQEAFGETNPILEFYVKCTIESSDPNWYMVTVDENISLGDVVVPYRDTTEGKIWHSSIHEMVYAPGMFIAKVRYFSDEQDATAEILYNVTGGE